MDNLALDNNLLNAFKAFAGSHFMFNVMNTVQSDLLLSKNKEAFQTLQIFNRLHKHAVRSSNDHFVALGDEIQFINQYLAMEHIRFSGRKFPRTLTCGHHDVDFMMPSFVIQSFVENAVLLSMENRTASSFTIHLEQVSEKVILQIRLHKHQGTRHAKLEQKLQLAELRLRLMQDAGLITYELSWNNPYLMELNILPTDN